MDEHNKEKTGKNLALECMIGAFSSKISKKTFWHRSKWLS